jgi:hypothetical protein
MANIWQDMKMNHAIRGFTVIVVGIIITIFLWWFFSGFGFWQVPGMAILFIGLAEILYTAYGSVAKKKSGLLHAGLLLFLVGVAGYLSLMSHVMLATLLVVSLAILVVGLVLVAIGFFRAFF